MQCIFIFFYLNEYANNLDVLVLGDFLSFLLLFFIFNVQVLFFFKFLLFIVSITNYITFESYKYSGFAFVCSKKRYVLSCIFYSYKKSPLYILFFFFLKNFQF
jgi:hypothetical protein